jgi:hypothetical protein
MTRRYDAMPIYEKPVWGLMHEMVEDMGLRKGEVFSKDQVLAWFAERYPRIKKGTISAHLTRLSTNAASRIHHHIDPEVHDLFFKIDARHFRLYDAEKDPAPVYEAGRQSGKPASVRGTETPLADEILEVIEEHERGWRERLEAFEKRVRALEQENEWLRRELDRGRSALEETGDEVLRERLSRLSSAPLDTIIREAGVVLEDRLRVVGQAESTLYGTGLVDAVLDPHRGSLIFSEHRGEQDGVRMLYRGAMQFVRNPPMHKLVQYPESTARLFVRLIDSLLQLLSELEPWQRGEVMVGDVRRMLTRRPIPEGQRVLYKALFEAGDEGLSRCDLARATNRSKHGLAGVLGALGHRINGTEGLEGKGGIEAVIDVSMSDEGDWHYRMRPVLREALKAEGIV